MFDQYMPKLRCRAAMEGEELVAHRFRNDVTRMVTKRDFERWLISMASDAVSDLSPAVEHSQGLWQSIKTFFADSLNYYGFISLDRAAVADPEPIIVLPSEALLRVYKISPSWQRRYALHGQEDALFIEVMPVSETVRYGLCFGNGIVIPLRQLPEGQQVKVLRRAWAESLEPEPALIRAR